MKIYKKIMDFIAWLEKWILVLSTVLILVLTVGNVLSRKVIHRSWSFTEELVVAVFVLITLMAAALACREGELVSLPLVTDRMPKKRKENFCTELAGMDLLVLCTHRGRVYAPAFYRILH